MSSPLKPVFSALNKHTEIVERALREPVGVGEEASDPGVKALRDVNVLRASGEHGYRLHSGLREFAHDVLQMHPALQRLAEIGSRTQHMHTLWNMLQDARAAGDHETMDLALEDLEVTAFDIGEVVERNLRWLGVLLSTRFGNVRTLAAKTSQNRFYQQQSANLTDDLMRLGRVGDRIEAEARDRGLPRLAATLRNTLLSKLTRWTQTLSQYQTQIRRELFQLREVERRNVLLARTALLLRQQPGWTGVEVNLPEEVPALLLAHPLLQVPLPRFAPHLEPLDGDRLVRELVSDEVRSLPRLETNVLAPKEKVPQQRLTPKTSAQTQSTPASRALSKVAHAVIEHARRQEANVDGVGQSLSLQDWRSGDADASSMAPGLWLAFTVSALRNLRFRVVLVRQPALPGERFRHTFDDALVSPTAEARQIYARTLGRKRLAHVPAAALEVGPELASVTSAP